VFDFIGAPEEIRTPDPQIRSLNFKLDSAAKNCKPKRFRPECDQGLSSPIANRNQDTRGAPPGAKKRSPTSAATERGADHTHTAGTALLGRMIRPASGRIGVFRCRHLNTLRSISDQLSKICEYECADRKDGGGAIRSWDAV
jgi:hypothetical protein